MGGLSVNVQTIEHLGAGTVSRPRLADLLRDDAYRVVSMVAPAGYGKSTALRSWPLDDRPVYYVKPDAVREDGTGLLFRVRRALDVGAPYVLVVDGIAAPAPNLLTALFLHVHSAPEGSRLLVSSRRPIDWAAALNLVGTDVRHVGPAELAFNPDEAKEMLVTAGVDIDDARADALFERMSGWPIAYCLCALLLRQADQPARVVDEVVTETGELLPGLVRRLVSGAPAGLGRFLSWTSVLSTLSGPVCDWLLETTDSSATLAALAGHNSLVIPVGGDGGTYRYQRLFGELLRTELNDREPDVSSHLHMRAGEWFAQRGDDVAARWHWQAAHTAARTSAVLPDNENIKRPAGAPDLSPAELQVLAFLPSHLSFADIGMRVGRSAQAIQRLAIGIYRKLGVISRRDAVERGLVLGLIAREALTFPA